MQFSCDSCKALLQISDEKLRGKRLVVKCKRCGSRIQIADPALGTPNRVEPVMATPRSVTTVSGVPTAPDSDIESTRAIDTDLLARALRASKQEDDAAGGQPSQGGDAPAWFALIANKQEGPFSRAELALKTAQGTIGPRTYLWREGMGDWVRAKDVPEAAPFFAEQPLGRNTPAATPRVESGAGMAEAGAPRSNTPGQNRAAPRAMQDFGMPSQGSAQDGFDRAESAAAESAGPPGGDSAADLQQWASSELDHSPEDEPLVQGGAPKQQRTDPRPAQSLAAPARLRPWPWIVAGIVIVLLAAGVAAAVMVLGRDSRPAAPAPGPGGQAGQPRGDPGAPGTRTPPADEPPPAAAGLSATVLRQKVDENREALQACVDYALKLDPSLKSSKVLIATTIAPSGAVTSATIEDKAIDGTTLGTCLKRTTRSIVFPPFTGEPFEVEIPILVRPKKG
jgi:predicted Zn finger-like uncharacterized protein